MSGMKCVILAGGRGTRLGDELQLRPKPMVEIGGRPILWHIMKIYAQAGITDFILCLGYRGHVIKEYFMNYFLYNADMTVDLGRNTVDYHDARAERWRVTLVDTGEDTMTGGRVRRIRSYVECDDAFCLTYGDGVSDVDLKALIAFHCGHGLQATMTVVRPPGRFGVAAVDQGRVVEFNEKPVAEGYINGGFFVLSPRMIDLIDGDETPLELAPIARLVAMQQLAAWQHDGFWLPMDTPRDKALLEALWQSGRPPWKTWD